MPQSRPAEPRHQPNRGPHSDHRTPAINQHVKLRRMQSAPGEERHARKSIGRVQFEIREDGEQLSKRAATLPRRCKKRAPATGSTHQSARAPRDRRRSPSPRASRRLVLQSYQQADSSIYGFGGGGETWPLPRIGKGVPAACCTGVALGVTGGTAVPVFGPAAGVEFGPGCVPPVALGGFAAAAGCPRISECKPSTETGFGVGEVAAGAFTGGLAGCAAPVAVTGTTLGRRRGDRSGGSRLPRLQISELEFHRAGDRDVGDTFGLIDPAVAVRGLVPLFPRRLQLFGARGGSLVFVGRAALHRAKRDRDDRAEADEERDRPNPRREKESRLVRMLKALVGRHGLIR